MDNLNLQTGLGAVIEIGNNYLLVSNSPNANIKLNLSPCSMMTVMEELPKTGQYVVWKGLLSSKLG